MRTPFKAPYKTLVWYDLFKSAILATINSCILSILLLFTNKIPTWVEVHAVLLTVVSTLASNLIKNFYTNSHGQLFKTEPPPPQTTTP